MLDDSEFSYNIEQISLQYLQCMLCLHIYICIYIFTLFTYYAINIYKGFYQLTLIFHFFDLN